MVAVAQHKRMAWNALAAALLVGVALITDQPTWLLLGGMATIVGLLLAWKSQSHWMLFSSASATALVVTQAMIPPLWRWGNGLVLMGVLLVTALTAWLGRDIQQGNRAFRKLSIVAMLLAYFSSQLTYIVHTGHPERFPWFPTLDISPASLEQLFVGTLGLVIFFLIRHAITRQYQPLVRRLALFSTLTYSMYFALVFSPLWGSESLSASIVLLSSEALWALLVALVCGVVCLPNKATIAQAKQRSKEIPAWRVTLNDYLTLMKYRVASLLLVTTLGGMIVAAQGWPSWSLIGWVMLGGLLSVGGAGSLNHYLDRDLDINMGRTSRRPIPAGRMAPWKALVFGLVLSVLQFAIFWFKVNPLSAWLSLGGLLYYVLIYTMWLKRTSTQNIVIGGAAGAFPPLVGWAAVTGDLSLGALFLFAIVFYWTPPHFWALALMRKEDYARAGVPMLPVVMGEKETRRQIVLYTLLMIAITSMLVPLRIMGFFYLICAILLNAKFLWDAVRLYRYPSNKNALTLYKYSLLYLALLFGAMVVDSVFMG